MLSSFTNGCFSKDQCKFTSIEFFIYLVLFVFKILLLLCCHLRNPVWNNSWKLTFPHSSNNYLQIQRQASCCFYSEMLLKHKTTAKAFSVYTITIYDIWKGKYLCLDIWFTTTQENGAKHCLENSENEKLQWRLIFSQIE